MYKKSTSISREKKSFSKTEKPKFEKRHFDKPGNKNHKSKIKKQKPSTAEGIRINKYIANAGICSRREADTLIESGAVRINGVICTQLGTRIMPNDKVEFGGETLVSEKKVYLLMNKPKGYITTTDDPQERKTVMHLIEGACKERIYPVGRLDRQTTGVLLFTNDGEMAKKLTHPSHGARKIYHVTLDKNITKNDLQTIAKGVELEDGFVPVDEINLIVGTKNEVGIQLHSGMNRVVRRMFEKFDYKVVKLDRVLFAELTKKDLPRGHYRILSEKEVAFLKMK
ncbi:MAG: rRNA pseudouridine synthase [Bacteroidales bacterium]|jgi:23S rRNA pseudouridine2605 synthase|nr:rRNA pseudouridine synthase [Bacteroidales bacterium]